MNWTREWLKCVRLQGQRTRYLLKLMESDPELPSLFHNAAELRAYLTRHGCTVDGPQIDRIWQSYKRWIHLNPVVVIHRGKAIPIRAL